MGEIILWLLGFIGLEAVLFALSAMVGPDWAVKNAVFVFVVGAVVLLFVFAIKNRRWFVEWAAESSQPKMNGLWINLTDAARAWRDEISSHPELEREAAVHDIWGVEKGVDPDISYPKKFLWEIIVGVNEANKLKVRGRPVNGSEVIEIPSPLGERQTAHSNIQNLMLTGAEGRAYTDIEVQRDSIRDYVAWQSGNWIGKSDAAQLVYDELTSGRYADQGQIIELVKSLGEDSTNLWDHVGTWIVEGIKSGAIEAQGTCEHRSQLEYVPIGIDDNLWGKRGEYDVLSDSGNRWKLLKFDRRGIMAYLNELENDEPKNSPENGED